MTPARESSALWLDCGIGVAGDMLTGALVAVGADAARVSEAVLACARAAGAEGALGISFRPVVRAGIAATQTVVTALESSQPRRGLADITRILAAADLEPNVADDAGAVFALIAQAEAAVHGCDVEEVHFHEVGALDSIADVVGTCAALEALGVESVSASAVALGAGRIRVAHGDLPVPVPAVAELAVGWRTVRPRAAGAGEPHRHGEDGHAHHAHDRPAEVLTDDVGELATPTGLALGFGLGVLAGSALGLSARAARTRSATVSRASAIRSAPVRGRAAGPSSRACGRTRHTGSA